MSRTTFYQCAFFCSHQKKVIVSKVFSIVKQFLQLSIHGIFSCIQHLYIQRKTTKNFKFELLCHFYVPYDIYRVSSNAGNAGKAGKQALFENHVGKAGKNTTFSHATAGKARNLLLVNIICINQSHTIIVIFQLL